MLNCSFFTIFREDNMCSGSRRKLGVDDLGMEGEVQNKQEGHVSNFSALLELSAADDLDGFRKAVEEDGCDINDSGLWYGRRIGSKKMGNDERTPLLIASYFGSKRVLSYILGKGCVDVNRACGSDGATALHCAIAGGSVASFEVVKLLLDASADVDLVDANGNRPADLIAHNVFGSRRKMLENLLKGNGFERIEEQKVLNPIVLKEGSEKKEYPVDPSLPDIKNGIYGTDEFRMYTFKVKPCSRAYSHDWTECPFVHPGENARRRDPRKYHYTCVPCPDFRRGTCQRGDSCEYAHGIFECWLHPAQYRTRMCKDESSCNRRVCFFAHRPDELRPLYASTGSAVPSPRSYSLGGSLDIASLSPLSLGSPSMMIASPGPTSTPPLTPPGPSSPRSRFSWPNQINLPTPTLQLPGSRLKKAIHARDSDLDQLMDDISFLASPKGMHLRQNINQNFVSSYPQNLNARASAFAKRSQSFIDRNAPSYHGTISSPISASTLSGWGSPDGKLDWGMQKDELGKLRKSASFGIRSSGSTSGTSSPMPVDEPDVSWVQSLVRDAQFDSSWGDQLYMEQEQILA